jgi:hypothetical protein
MSAYQHIICTSINVRTGYRGDAPPGEIGWSGAP